MLYLYDYKLPENAFVSIGLKKIYGVGKKNSILICKKLGFAINLKVKNLSEDQITEILDIIEHLNIKIGYDLKRLKHLISKKLVFIKSYKGLRKQLGLPVRGQRTHSNAKTCRKH